MLSRHAPETPAVAPKCARGQLLAARRAPNESCVRLRAAIDAAERPRLRLPRVSLAPNGAIRRSKRRAEGFPHARAAPARASDGHTIARSARARARDVRAGASAARAVARPAPAVVTAARAVVRPARARASAARAVARAGLPRASAARVVARAGRTRTSGALARATVGLNETRRTFIRERPQAASATGAWVDTNRLPRRQADGWR